MSTEDIIENGESTLKATDEPTIEASPELPSQTGSVMLEATSGDPAPEA